jgi:hypothetical protein
MRLKMIQICTLNMTIRRIGRQIDFKIHFTSDVKQERFQK